MYLETDQRMPNRMFEGDNPSSTLIIRSGVLNVTHLWAFTLVHFGFLIKRHASIDRTFKRKRVTVQNENEGDFVFKLHLIPATGVNDRTEQLHCDTCWAWAASILLQDGKTDGATVCGQCRLPWWATTAADTSYSSRKPAVYGSYIHRHQDIALIQKRVQIIPKME